MQINVHNATKQNFTKQQVKNLTKNEYNFKRICQSYFIRIDTIIFKHPSYLFVNTLSVYPYGSLQSDPVNQSNYIGLIISVMSTLTCHKINPQLIHYK